MSMTSPSLLVAIDVSPGLCEPLVSEELLQYITGRYLNAESSLAAHTKFEKFDSLLVGQSEAFDELNRSGYPCRLSLVSAFVHSLTEMHVNSEVRLIFFSSAGRSSWVGSHLWKDNQPIQLGKGGTESLARMRLFLESQNDNQFDIWSSILQIESNLDNSRLLIFSGTDSSAKFLRVGFASVESLLKLQHPGLIASFVPIGDEPDSESIQALHQLFSRLGGFVFPAVSAESRVAEIADVLSRHFIMEDHQIVRERMQVGSRTIFAPFSSPTDFSWITSKRLNPSVLYLRCLSEDTSSLKWRWMRGFRFHRERFRGVRDIFFESSGQLGLDFRQPDNKTPWWTLRSSQPPSSSLDLTEGSILFSVNGRIIDGEVNSVCFRRLLGRRPVVLSFGSPEDRPGRDTRSAWIQACAEELSIRAIVENIKDFDSKIPLPFVPRRQTPWNRVPAHAFDKSHQCLLIASTVMCDHEGLLALAQVDSKFRNLFLSEQGRVGRSLFRYALRRSFPGSKRIWGRIFSLLSLKRQLDVGRADMLMRATYGISIADISSGNEDSTLCFSPFLEFRPDKIKPLSDILCGVTAACFLHSRVKTQRLLTAGVPLELIYAEFIIRISLGAKEAVVCSWLNSIFCLEGIGSIFWLRLFLSLLEQFEVSDSGDLIATAFQAFNLDRVTESTITAALSIPVSSQWLKRLMSP